MIKLSEILLEILTEDRCKRIADRKYDKPSAYKSGAIVRCRDGKIWKDLKEEEKESLHKWFKRQGAPGKSGGWVDCNTCKTVDGKKKCKSCGRQKGESRSKYPSCRPTPSQCSRPGKGKKWGKTNEAEINTEKTFPFSYTGVRKNDVDDSGGLMHTYTFETGNHEYTVYFFDDGEGTYERVFGTVERNLAPTQENTPYKIYRTVTAITLDFLNKVSKSKKFKQLKIEPISKQRGAIVKRFVDDYIAPKYDVKQVGRNIFIKKEMINEIQIEDKAIADQLEEFYLLQNKIKALSEQLKDMESSYKKFSEQLAPMFETMKQLQEKTAEAESYIVIVDQEGYDRKTHKYKKAYDFALSKLNEATRSVCKKMEDEESTISKIATRFSIKTIAEAKVFDKAKMYISKVVGYFTKQMGGDLSGIDKANGYLARLATIASK